MSNYNPGNFLYTDTPNNWTREQQRVFQFTICEQDLRRFKSMGDWEMVLNILEDVLLMQMELMEENYKDTSPDSTRNVVKLRGKDTTMYQLCKKKIRDLRMRTKTIKLRSSDPATRRNNQEEAFQLEEEIRDIVEEIFHNNVLLGITYQKHADPKKAAFG